LKPRHSRRSLTNWLCGSCLFGAVRTTALAPCTNRPANPIAPPPEANDRLRGDEKWIALIEPTREEPDYYRGPWRPTSCRGARVRIPRLGAPARTGDAG